MLQGPEVTRQPIAHIDSLLNILENNPDFIQSYCSNKYIRYKS